MSSSFETFVSPFEKPHGMMNVGSGEEDSGIAARRVKSTGMIFNGPIRYSIFKDEEDGGYASFKFCSRKR
jgi:hypothetical protein